MADRERVGREPSPSAAILAWIMKNRRFARDYEQLTEVAETLIIAACAPLVRRRP